MRVVLFPGETVTVAFAESRLELEVRLKAPMNTDHRPRAQVRSIIPGEKLRKESIDLLLDREI